MGFIRQQEERLAMRFLMWHYQSMKLPIPAPSELQKQAAKMVGDAHRVARERGRDVISIIKERLEELKKRAST
jgi:hypothetical protein